MRRMMFSLIGTGAALFVVLVAMWSSMASTQSEIATTLASTVATQAAVTQSVIGLKADLKDGLCRLTDDIRDVRKAIDVRDIDKRRYQ